MILFRTAAAISLSTLMAGAALGRERPYTVSYGCSDIVAVGRIETTNYTDLSEPDAVLSHGRFDLRITIKQILRGRETRKVVPAFGMAHGQLRSNLDFLMVLSPQADGTYRLAQATIRHSRPRSTLAKQCRELPTTN